jgi:hypothetical protein
MALQTQLDTNNQKLADTRSQLLKDYSGLRGEIDRGLTNDASYLKNAMNTVNSNANALPTFLRGKADQFRREIDNRIQEADAYKNTKLGTPVEDPRSEEEVTYITPSERRASFKWLDAPTAENVGGVEAQRGGWNAIQDLLGSNNRIGLSSGGVFSDEQRPYQIDIPSAGRHDPKQTIIGQPLKIPTGQVTPAEPLRQISTVGLVPTGAAKMSPEMVAAMERADAAVAKVINDIKAKTAAKKAEVPDQVAFGLGPTTQSNPAPVPNPVPSAGPMNPMDYLLNAQNQQQAMVNRRRGFWG